jgi:hypothetical protein
MTMDRRSFVRNAGLGIAASGALPAMAGAQTPSERAEALWADERHAMEEMTPQEIWDVTWTKRVTGKHKALFDIPEVAGGVGVNRASIWGRQYMDTLKVAASDLTTVLSIRHAGVFMLMTQTYWETYEVGKARKLNNEDGSVMQHNPVLPAPGAPGGSSMMLDQQIRNGAIVLGCNLAFRAVVSLVEKKDGLTNAQAREKAKSFILPGVIMQPSGIFANVLAQEAGCVFIYAV